MLHWAEEGWASVLRHKLCTDFTGPRRPWLCPRPRRTSPVRLRPASLPDDAEWLGEINTNLRRRTLEEHLHRHGPAGFDDDEFGGGFLIVADQFFDESGITDVLNVFELKSLLEEPYDGSRQRTHFF